MTIYSQLPTLASVTIIKGPRRTGKTTEIARSILIDLLNDRKVAYVSHDPDGHELSNCLQVFVGAKKVDDYLKKCYFLTPALIKNTSLARGLSFDSVYMDDCFVETGLFFRTNKTVCFIVSRNLEVEDYIIRSHGGCSLSLVLACYSSPQAVKLRDELGDDIIDREYTFSSELPFWKIAGARILTID